MSVDNQTKPKKPSKLERGVVNRIGILDRDASAATEEVAFHPIQSPAIRLALKKNRSMGDLDLSQIDPDPKQVRQVKTDTEAFRDLLSSIREHGVIEPITVRWIEGTQRFQIITGERRFRAAKEAGLERIPAIIRDVDDTKKAIHQLVENIQRENMNPIEEAKAFKLYLAATGKQKQVLAKELGKDKSYVTKTMALLEKLSREEQQVLASVATSQLPGKSLIYEVLASDNPELRMAVLKGQLTIKQLRERVERKTPARATVRFVTKTFRLTSPEATVTVRLKGQELDDSAVTEALRNALSEQDSKP